MTGTELIREFQQMPEREQDTVAEFVSEFRRQKQLTPEELGNLAKEMVEADDNRKKAELKEQIVAGFYGR